MSLRVAVITVSDRCARGEAVDESGPALVESATRVLECVCEPIRCVPDDPDEIERSLRDAVASGCGLVLTTGGTGLGPRDNTPEAASRVIERQHPQLLELSRARCAARSGPMVYLSRGVAGVAGGAMIVTLPGSRRGCVESFESIADVLPHAIGVIAGGDHPR